MCSLFRWLLGMPKEEQPAPGLALDERLLLFEIRDELTNLASAINQVTADMEEMRSNLEKRIDDLEASISQISGDIFEMRGGVPIEDVSPDAP